MATSNNHKPQYRHHKGPRAAASRSFPRAEKAFNWHTPDMRQCADPLADNVIATIGEGLDEAENLRQINAVLGHTTRNDQINPEVLSPLLVESVQTALRDYLEKSSELPADLDDERLLNGENFFVEHGPVIILLLMCKSMPQCYAAKNASEILAGTGRMSKELKRRMAETGQFLIDAMSPGGLRPGGRGIASAQKVRLMHAAIRHHVKHHTDYPNVPSVGTPINQEDMIATLLSFSLLVTEGMTQLGIPYTTQEAEDYLYTCNVMGYLLGVREEILPRNMAEARVAWEDIIEREYAASEAGQQLTAAMVDLLESTTPGTTFKELPLCLVRYLTGTEVAHLVKLPPVKSQWGIWTQVTVPVWVFMARVLGHVTAKHSAFKEVYDDFSLHLLNTLERVGLDGQPAKFYITDECRANWGMTPNADGAL